MFIKVKVYESVRAALVGIYHNNTFFGRVALTPFPGRSNELLDENEIQEREDWQTQQKNEKEQIKKGYTRVDEKRTEINSSSRRQ